MYIILPLNPKQNFIYIKKSKARIPHLSFAFSCFSAHIFNIEIYSYSNILRLQAKCRKMF